MQLGAYLSVWICQWNPALLIKFKTMAKKIYNKWLGYASTLKWQSSTKQGLLTERDKAGNTKGESITVPLTCFDWFGLVCFENKNKKYQLSHSWFQASQTGGQQYSDTSPFSIPWIKAPYGSSPHQITLFLKITRQCWYSPSLSKLAISRGVSKNHLPQTQGLH